MMGRDGRVTELVRRETGAGTQHYTPGQTEKASADLAPGSERETAQQSAVTGMPAEDE